MTFWLSARIEARNYRFGAVHMITAAYQVICFSLSGLKVRKTGLMCLNPAQLFRRREDDEESAYGELAVMSCSRILPAECDENRRPLACRRSVSWYGVRLCILKESIQALSEDSQVRDDWRTTV